MKKRLRVKFAVLYGLFALLSFIAVSTFTMSLTRKYETKKVADSLYQDASRIASASLIQSYTKSSSSRKDLYNFLSAAAAYQNSTIWLMDTSGNILINTSLPFEESEDPEKLPEMDPGEFTGSYYQIGTFFDYYSKDVLSVVSPVTSGDAVKGYIVIHCYLSKIERECNSVLNISYFTLLVILGLSLILAFGFWRLISRPLDRLIYAAGKYAAGNLDYTFIKEPTDELEYIGASLQYLAGRAGKGGESQRKFISNISHDFRSPLTSIKGYVEAILDGTIPVEIQDRYLHIVLSETERLEKLTKGLLTLNTFDDNGYLMEMSDFDINEVIRRTLETFEGRCNERGIRFSLLFDEASLPVHADMEKIQQVLYNLIDNAIKFCPDGGRLSLRVQSDGGKARVSVENTGPTIDKDELPLLFDRFHKADKSRSADREGWGLGLYIAKTIVGAHGGDIWATSENGVTQFNFTLPAVR